MSSTRGTHKEREKEASRRRTLYERTHRADARPWMICSCWSELYRDYDVEFAETRTTEWRKKVVKNFNRIRARAPPWQDISHSDTVRCPSAIWLELLTSGPWNTQWMKVRNSEVVNALWADHRYCNPSSGMLLKQMTAVTAQQCITSNFYRHEFSIMNSPIDGIPIKPMRPLTAYQIFLQIEREYIIQTSEGEIADKSSLDNKVYLDDVATKIFVSSRLVCRSWQA